MKPMDGVIRRETVYVAIWTVILSVLMNAVFLILGRWDLTVLWGSLWGSFAAVLHFFLLGIGVQIAVSKEDPKDAKKVIQLSHTLRFLLWGVMAILGVTVPLFHSVAAVVPLLFPRIGILFRPRFGGMDDKGGA